MYSEDPNLAKCRMGYVIMYCGYPIFWASRQQSAFALNTMESNYVARSAALQYIMPVMQDRIDNVEGSLYFQCKLFEDNSGVFSKQKLPRVDQTSLNFADPYSGGKISPSKMKECEDIGF
jgi:hypothetical protein